MDETVIISMSGNAVEDQREMYQGLNVAMFVQKPLGRQQVLGILEMAEREHEHQ